MSSPATTIERNISSAPERDELVLLERRARRFWVSGIVGLLGLQVAIGAASVWLSFDPSVAFVPDYHQAALDWDASHRTYQTTQRLGWSIRPWVGANEQGKRQIEILVHAPDGKPIEELNLTAHIYHHARGSAIYKTRLVETSPGRYLGETTLVRPGLWQVKMQLEGKHGIARDSRELEVL